MITTFAPIDAVGIATATVTLPPVRVAAAVGFVTAVGTLVLGAALAAAVLGDAAVTGTDSTGATGVTAADATDAALVPSALVAVTLNVYDAPFASPVIVQFVAGVDGATDVTVQLSPVPAVAVYPVIVLPPSLVGADHVTVTEPLPGVPPTSRGRPGAPGLE